MKRLARLASAAHLLRLVVAVMAVLLWIAAPAWAEDVVPAGQPAEDAYGVHGETPPHGEGHAAGVDGKRLALQLANFAILLFILIKYAGGALNKALRSRHDKMKLDLEEAHRLRAAAESKLAAQAARLTNLENEIVALRLSMQESAEGEKQRIIAAAEARVQRMEEETRFLMEQQVKQAQLTFRAEVATAAARMAESIVRREVNAGDQQRLVTSFVAEVQSGSASERIA